MIIASFGLGMIVGYLAAIVIASMLARQEDAAWRREAEANARREVDPHDPSIFT